MKAGLYKIIIFSALLGLLISSYLTYSHYAGTGAVCINEEHIKTCSNVLNGPYAETIFNIPNSLIGVLGFVLFLILGYLGIKEKNVRDLMLLFSSISVLFVLYLAYLVFLVIRSFCIWCFAVWILIIIIFICSIFIKKLI